MNANKHMKDLLAPAAARHQEARDRIYACYPLLNEAEALAEVLRKELPDKTLVSVLSGFQEDGSIEVWLAVYASPEDVFCAITECDLQADGFHTEVDGGYRRYVLRDLPIAIHCEDPLDLTLA